MIYLLWIDASHWNILDILALKQYGVGGIIGKASSGNYSIDARYVETQIGCSTFQMPTASYHWNDPLNTARSQADKFLATIEPWLNSQLFLMIDQEQWWANWAEWNAARRGLIPWSEVDRLPSSRINDTCQELLAILKAETGKKVGIYSNGFFVLEWCPEMLGWIDQEYQWWSQYPYNKTVVSTTWSDLIQYYLPPTNEPSFPSAWPIEQNFDIWQFSGDKFILPGCVGPVDLNYVKPVFLGEVLPVPLPYPANIYIPSTINIRINPWQLDWGSTKTGKTVPVLAEKKDSDGKSWYQIPAWVAGWLVKPK